MYFYFLYCFNWWWWVLAETYLKILFYLYYKSWSFCLFSLLSKFWPNPRYSHFSYFWGIRYLICKNNNVQCIQNPCLSKSNCKWKNNKIMCLKIDSNKLNKKKWVFFTFSRLFFTIAGSRWFRTCNTWERSLQHVTLVGRR